MSGRLLCYVAPNHRSDLAVVHSAAALTADHPASGLVVRGPHTLDVVRMMGARGDRGGSPVRPQLVVVDAGVWTSTIATTDVPMVLPTGEGALYPVELDGWAQSWLQPGAHCVLTPSGFVESEDWVALKAVLVAGARASDPRVRTLVATDAAMLDPARLSRFVEVVGERRGRRPLAFVFAANKEPLARTERMAGLRGLLAAFPGTVVLATEVLAATDVIARGGSAAIGLLSSQRRPCRPCDGSGGGFSPGYRPGMFLRELWETRNPSFYADWYRNRRPAPVCAACGRGPASFTTDQADKDAIVVHNVHAWLEAFADLRRAGGGARAWLVDERRRARDAHQGIGPSTGGAPVDALLDGLCTLDGPPPQRRTVPAPAPTG